MPNQNVRSLLTSFCVNLCHLIMSLQQSVIQSVSPVLSQKIWINTERSHGLAASVRCIP
ncbi:MAG: hypothetical protein RIG63_03800 [Coleofasciculus chthonoplastes F3-SA18-01]|uniref:hypothetical protein n=1 Tax=Coleofasciculus chthonoplastes TaxID=64178 RepID=UPI0032F3B14F